MSRKVHITTIDNPFNPFKDFDNWFLYDVEKGYYSCSRIARLVDNLDNTEEKEEDELIEEAIDRLVEIDPLDLYRKLVEEA